MKKLTERVKEIMKKRESLEEKNWKKIIWKKGEKESFNKTNICWLCLKEIKKEEKKVADHCHLTNHFRGAAHLDCNLNASLPRFTPVFIHNLDGYDSHLFLKNMGNEFGKITCIPNNEEKYISFSLEIVWKTITDEKGKKEDLKHLIRFVDSLKFMNSSLANLVKNL